MIKIQTIGAFFFLFCTTVFAQKTIKGTVKDGKTQEGIAGVHVRLLSSERLTVTDEGGNFSLLVNGSEDVRLGFQMVGYKDFVREVKASENEALLILMEEGVRYLSEIEVKGGLHKNKQVYYQTSKLPVDYQHQVQTVSVFGQQQIQETQATTLNEAVDYTPGIYQFATWGGWGNGFAARGVRSVTTLRNGVKLSGSIEQNPDLSSLERVEIVKGSAAILNGNVSTGATINLITKKPQFQKGGKVQLGYGSWQTARTEIDLYGPLSDKVAYRIAIGGQKGNSFRNKVGSKNYYVNPSVTYKIDDKTSLTAEFLNSVRGYTTDIGNVIYKKVISENHSRYVGLEEDKNEVTTKDFSFTLHRKIAEKLNLRFAAAFINMEGTLKRLSGYNDKRFYKKGKELWFKRYYSDRKSSSKRNYYQLDFLGEKLQTGSISHTFQAGIDFWRNESGGYGSQSVFLDSVDVNGFIPHKLSQLSSEQQNLYKSLPKRYESTNASTNGGITFQNQMVFDKLRLTLGARISYVSSKSESFNFQRNKTTNTPESDAVGVSPLAAISYDVNTDFTVFAGYTNTFDEYYSGRLGIDGEYLGNSYVNQIEFGFKSMILNNKLGLNLTAYRIFENNRVDRAVDAEGEVIQGKGSGYVRTGKFRNQGVELEASAQITETLRADLGYAYIDAKYKQSTRYMTDSSPFNTPTHSGSAWLSFSPKGAIEGLFLGLGTKFVGERTGNDYVKINWHGITALAKPRTMKPYTQIDFAAAYKFSKNLSVQGKLNNITNTKAYYSYREYYINPINPFNWHISLSYIF